MVARKKTIPPLVDVGTFVGINAIPSGTIYQGQMVQIVGVGNMIGGDYSPSTNLAIPIVKVITAANVTSSGVLKRHATNQESGTLNAEYYKIAGVAASRAPVQDTYQQLGVGKPIVAPENITLPSLSTK